MSNKNTPDDELEYVSKSQIKRELQELHKLAVELINLSINQRNTLPLDDELIEALELADKIKNKREAFRRHINLVGKLLRSRNVEELEIALEKIRSRHSQSNAFFHKIEGLRDRLLEEGDTVINEVIAMNVEIDRQKLRQLVRKAKKEQLDNQPPKFYRELFKFLRDHLEVN